jgi:hypothetical protein
VFVRLQEGTVKNKVGDNIYGCQDDDDNSESMKRKNFMEMSKIIDNTSDLSKLFGQKEGKMKKTRKKIT